MRILSFFLYFVFFCCWDFNISKISQLSQILWDDFLQGELSSLILDRDSVAYSCYFSSMHSFLSPLGLCCVICLKRFADFCRRPSPVAWEWPFWSCIKLLYWCSTSCLCLELQFWCTFGCLCFERLHFY